MELERACDSCSAAMSHQIKILDYEAVLGLLLDWKQKYDTLVISEYDTLQQSPISRISNSRSVPLSSDRLTYPTGSPSLNIAVCHRGRGQCRADRESSGYSS